MIKNFFTVTLVAFYLFSGYSQSNEECFSNLSIFAEYAKVKNYDAAYEPWLKVKSDCPSLNNAIYVYGERILKTFIKNNEGDSKKKFQDDLIKTYDEWLKFFPKTKSGKSQKGKILAIKAQSMIDFKLGTEKEIYDILYRLFF